jgi:hypothetical protein
LAAEPLVMALRPCHPDSENSGGEGIRWCGLRPIADRSAGQSGATLVHAPSPVGAAAPSPGGCRCAEGGTPDPCHRDHPAPPGVKVEPPQPPVGRLAVPAGRSVASSPPSVGVGGLLIVLDGWAAWKVPSTGRGPSRGPRPCGRPGGDGTLLGSDTQSRWASVVIPVVEMWESPRSGINRAAHDLPANWAGRPSFQPDSCVWRRVRPSWQVAALRPAPTTPRWPRDPSRGGI